MAEDKNMNSLFPVATESTLSQEDQPGLTAAQMQLIQDILFPHRVPGTDVIWFETSPGWPMYVNGQVLPIPGVELYPIAVGTAIFERVLDCTLSTISPTLVGIVSPEIGAALGQALLAGHGG